MTDVRRWTLFALLSPEFVDNIQSCVVFGNAGSEAVILTKSDEVFGIGTNCCSCLGIYPLFDLFDIVDIPPFRR